MKKKNPKELKKHKQEIIIAESKLFEFWEMAAFALHFLALILGTVSILFLFLNLHNEIFELLTEILEILTLLVIIILLINHIVKPIAKKRFIKGALGPFWGKKLTNVKTYLPEEVKLENGNVKLVKANGFILKSVKTNLFFEREKLFQKRFKYQMKFDPKVIANSSYFSKDNANVFQDVYDPNYLIYNVREKTLKIIVKRNTIVNGTPREVEWSFIFDPIKRKCSWSGLLPNSPVYGEWDWNVNENNNNSKQEVELIEFNG